MTMGSSSPVFTDFQGIAGLRAKAKTDGAGALKDVARQFEGIFLNMMLKSMREASEGDPLFDSHEGDMYRDMFDQQIALDIAAKRGIGLADSLIRQLSPHVANGTAMGLLIQSAQTVSPAGASTSPVSANVPPTPEVARPTQSFGSQRAFIEAIAPHAQQAARELGVTPKVLIAQAALETGWGKGMIRRGDGVSSNNLFNIKAGGAWEGERVGVTTLEYKGGVPYRAQASFRAYDSYAESFADYVRLIKSSPRYAEALRVADDPRAYVRALQQAGYATDPGYASKVTRILSSDMLA